MTSMRAAWSRPPATTSPPPPMTTAPVWTPGIVRVVRTNPPATTASMPPRQETPKPCMSQDTTRDTCPTRHLDWAPCPTPSPLSVCSWIHRMPVNTAAAMSMEPAWSSGETPSSTARYGASKKLAAPTPRPVISMTQPTPPTPWLRAVVPSTLPREHVNIALAPKTVRDSSSPETKTETRSAT